MGRFHKYSSNNCLLIAMQKPEATLVAGFKSWQTNFKEMLRREKSQSKFLPQSLISLKKRSKMKMEKKKYKK